MKNMLTAVALALGASLASAAQPPAALVTNGDFETGDFSGWTTTYAASGSDIYLNNGSGVGGSHAAAFGAVGTDYDAISQNLATTAGDGYTLTFSLASTGYSGNFIASVGGVTELSIGTTNNGYTQYSYDFFAKSSSTNLTFEGVNPPSWFYLDNVAVVANGTSAVPETSPAIMLGLGIAVLAGVSRRRRVA